MAKKYTVSKLPNGKYAAFDVRGNMVTEPCDEECYAHLYGSHWAHAPSLEKTLNLKRVDGVLTGRPFYCTNVAVYKDIDKKWKAVVNLEDAGNVQTMRFRTKNEALSWVRSFGNTKVPTKNILNPGLMG